MCGNVDKRCKTAAREEGWGLRPHAPNKRGRQLRRPYPHGNMPKISAVGYFPVQVQPNLLIYTGSVGSDFTSKRLKELCKRLTLNQRVPGSSPGAPTKLLRHLASPSGSHSDKRSAAIPTNRLLLFAPRDTSWSPRSAAYACASRRSSIVAPTDDDPQRATQRR
jgi:hypothetical protein